MIMKTCFSLLCRLLFSHLWHCWQRLTAAFISSGVFSLGSSDTAAGLQRIWSNVKLSIHMLNFKSHPRSLKYLSMNVVPRAYTSAKKFSWQEGNLVFKKNNLRLRDTQILNDLVRHPAQTGYQINQRQTRAIINARDHLHHKWCPFVMETYLQSLPKIPAYFFSTSILH